MWKNQFRPPLTKCSCGILFTKKWEQKNRYNLLQRNSVKWYTPSKWEVRQKETFVLLYTFHLLTDVMYLNLLKNTKLEFRPVAIKTATFQREHTLNLESPENTTHTTDLSRSSNWFTFSSFN